MGAIDPNTKFRANPDLQPAQEVTAQQIADTGGGSSLIIKDTTGHTVTTVGTIIAEAGLTVGGSAGSATLTPSGSPLTVTDDTTTVTSTGEIEFTSGATVTDAGGGKAQVAISGGALTVQDTNGNTETAVGTLTFETGTVGSGGANKATYTPPGGGGASVTVSLTSAQLKALNSSPFTIVAAPGAGKTIIPTFVEYDFTFGSVAYSNLNGTDGLSYAGALNAPVDINFNSGNAQLYVLVNGLVADGFAFVAPTAGLPISDAVNQALVLQSSVDWTDGDGTLIVTVAYYVSTNA